MCSHGEELERKEKLKTKWAALEVLVGDEKRLRLIAEDLVEHFEQRLEAMDGKAMVVCMSRRICVALCDEIIKLRPQWHSEDDAQGVLKIVMTGSASHLAAGRACVHADAHRRRGSGLTSTAKATWNAPQATLSTGGTATAATFGKGELTGTVNSPTEKDVEVD
jgi:hypothetical protein